MRTNTNLLFSLFIFSNIVLAQDSYKPLFKIYENGLYGYIDSYGAVVIPPKFKGAGEFSEGLAPVRENGYYGYIDETGKYVIEPRYDYARNFGYGYSLVYKDGTPNLIDKYGKNLTSTNYKDIFPLEKNMAKVGTFSGKFGICFRTLSLSKSSVISEVICLINNSPAFSKRKEFQVRSE